MEGLNRVTLLGNLGADAELRMTGSGQAVLNIRLATSETYLDKDKQRQERTEWHTVVVWGKRAEALGKILKKGDRILAEGGLRTTNYDRDGVKRYKTEVYATEILLQGGPARTGKSEREPAATSSGSGGSTGYEDDDIPF